MTKKSKPLLTAASIGRQFVRRDGALTGTIVKADDSFTYPFRCMKHAWSYTEDGFYFIDEPGDDRDLLREATPAEIAAGHALPVKERKAKEGRTHTLWCFESWASGEFVVVRFGSRPSAYIERSGRRSAGFQCGPIFKVTITCPAWNPK